MAYSKRLQACQGYPLHNISKSQDVRLIVTMIVNIIDNPLSPHDALKRNVVYLFKLKCTAMRAVPVFSVNVFGHFYVFGEARSNVGEIFTKFISYDV